MEPPPGVSGLTSTLTQATFSWLFHKDEEDGRQSEQIHGGAKGGKHRQMRFHEVGLAMGSTFSHPHYALLTTVLM